MKLYTGGYLSFYMPQRKLAIELTLQGPTPLNEILAELQIPLEEIHQVALNGELVEVETVVLQDSDTVRIFSSVGGG